MVICETSDASFYQLQQTVAQRWGRIKKKKIIKGHMTMTINNEVFLIIYTWKEKYKIKKKNF